MHAQLILFDGPRSPEIVAAGRRAGVERIDPLIAAHPGLAQDVVAQYLLTQPDGGEAFLVIAGSEDTLDEAARLIMTSELLPGEDPALLPGPSRVERYQVADVRPVAGAR